VKRYLTLLVVLSGLALGCTPPPAPAPPQSSNNTTAEAPHADVQNHLG